MQGDTDEFRDHLDCQENCRCRRPESPWERIAAWVVFAVSLGAVVAAIILS